MTLRNKDKTLRCGDDCRKRILLWVQRLVSNRDDVEDLCQEICMRCSLRRCSFRNNADFSTWLYKVAVNVVKDFFRKRSRQAEWLESEIDNETLWDVWEAQLWQLAMTSREERDKVQFVLFQLAKTKSNCLSDWFDCKIVFICTGSNFKCVEPIKFDCNLIARFRCYGYFGY